MRKEQTNERQEMEVDGQNGKVPKCKLVRWLGSFGWCRTLTQSHTHTPKDFTREGSCAWLLFYGMPAELVANMKKGRERIWTVYLAGSF